MHFSQGQIYFVIFFVCAFTLALIWSYRKDKDTNKKNYTGVWKVLLTVIVVLATLSFILKNMRNH
ncbi:MAG TPA: hypothetical protein VL651_02110 [Bacteroidia bacterium]|nr:hypothetical protein [Bacteroidia bacterium]